METCLDSRGPLVVTPRRHRSESVRDYISRLAEENAYGSPKVILALLGDRIGQELATLTDVVTSEAALLALEELADQPSGSLLRELWRPMESTAGAYYYVRGAPLPRDALMCWHAQCCPRCLDEAGLGREEWELSAVTVCAQHRVALVDTCPQCSRRLALVRPRLCACSHCGADLRLATSEPADDAEIALADYVAALAPYRLTLAGTTVYDNAESLFAVCRLMHREGATNRDPISGRPQFSSLRLAQRRAAMRAVAANLRGNSVDAGALHAKFAERVAHRVPFTGKDIAMESVVDELAADDSLSPEARRGLGYGSFSGGPATPIEVFGLRLPAYSDAEQACRFLECSELDWAWLTRQLPLEPTGELSTFDAESLLAARRRLDKLVPISELNSRVGVRGLVEQLRAFNVLPRTAFRGDRCDLDELVPVLDRLLDVSRSEKDDTSLVQVIEVCAAADRAYACAWAIATALGQALASFRWLPPYDMTGLWIAPSDASTLGLSLRLR